VTVTPAADRDGKAVAAKPRFIRKRLATLLAFVERERCVLDGVDDRLLGVLAELDELELELRSTLVAFDATARGLRSGSDAARKRGSDSASRGRGLPPERPVTSAEPTGERGGPHHGGGRGRPRGLRLPSALPGDRSG
jgi:hypothetical protein